VSSPRPLGFVARYRPWISLAVHGLVFAVALLAAFGLAYNFRSVFPYRTIQMTDTGVAITERGGWFLWWYLPFLVVAVPLKLFAFALFRQYHGSWRYVGLRDLLGVASASYVGSFLFMVAYFLVFYTHHPVVDYLQERAGVGFPQSSVFLSDLVATVGLVAICRVLWRLYHEEVKRVTDGHRRRLLVVGADRAGETVVREIIASGERHEVVGFIDDDASRWHNRIHGVEVLGPTSALPEVAEREEVEEILIALPGAPPREIRRIVELCQGTGVNFRTIPSVGDLIEGRVQISEIRDVDIADLLGRDPVQLDTNAIGQILGGKTILITGAGGSIGAEMCRQIARFEPRRLILLEQAENGLFEIDRELRARFPHLDVVARVGDICDATRVRSIFEEDRPSAVFHAAAHKHVPLMEINSGEALKNNVLGTRVVADVAAETGVAKVVMISTDKAVNPTSIMGCSKRVAELYVQHLSRLSPTQFVTVRFGNVLGSSGSVVPIFQRQIADGGPVTVTHAEMKRYFMTIPEAAQLVLQAGAMGRGGEIYVLDMGDPVKIVDLARDMIQLSGLQPGVDIEIEFIGIRPGEKLFEELSVKGEDMAKTSHPKIYIWKHRPENWDRLRGGIEKLIAIADTGDKAAIVAQLGALVPEFQPAPLQLPDTAVSPSASGATRVTASKPV
jgi:FlaA1/EpsC-like NDP-sugar epimerase